MFAAGVSVFGGASAWCGLAQNIHQLIAARALQGIGGALLVPGSLALISASFPLKSEDGQLEPGQASPPLPLLSVPFSADG